MYQGDLHLEIVLVDDGSTDLSRKIADEYAKKEDRIKVIHQENEGASAARNPGLEIAQGEYIAFLDSEDWISWKNKVTTKKWNAEEYGNGFDLQGFHLRCQLFREPLQSTPKPNQDGATLLVRNHAQ